MSRGNARAECAECERFRPIAGRRLCGGCYGRNRREGTLEARHPRVNNHWTTVLALWDEMVPDAEMVSRLGIKWSSIERAEHRSRARLRPLSRLT